MTKYFLAFLISTASFSQALIICDPISTTVQSLSYLVKKDNLEEIVSIGSVVLKATLVMYLIYKSTMKEIDINSDQVCCFPKNCTP